MAINPTVRKDELLAALRENRAKHRQVFEAALGGWRKEADRQLDEAKKRLAEGKRTRVYIVVPVPEDHTREYDRAIRSVEMHTGDTLNLTEHDMAQYVQDDWGWKGEWSQTTSNYANDVYVAAYGPVDQ